MSPKDCLEKHTLAILWTRFEALEKQMDERRQSDREALSLQAREYERRLDGLNNEHGRIEKAASLFVTREKFDAAVDELKRLVYIGVGALLAIQFGLTMWRWSEFHSVT